ncbi:DUF6325 family protein [Aquipuribacter sp. SD81]|uniref:DUF6325 family protein n=1 Tax=Aquipuribacter sp. SD81 TaxID=3127703 RepID=UPI00301751B0
MSEQQVRDRSPVDVDGPVDVAVIVFDRPRPDPDVAPALARLQEDGTVRLLDGAFVSKDADGRAGFAELADSDDGQAYTGLWRDRVDLLNDTDLAEVADGLDAGTSGLVLVWENVWAARFAETVRGSAGRLAAFHRIPHDRLAAALQAGAF